MSEMAIRVMGAMLYKSRGRWNEDRCWYLLRREMPKADDATLQA
jgi:hypothetical protein